MEQRIELKARVPDAPELERLDRIASQLFPQYSRSRLQLWIKAGQLTVDHQTRKPRDKLLGGELLEINASIEVRNEFQAEAMALEVPYEDEHLLIINKPVGLVTHPAPGHWQGTLLNGLLYQYPELAQLPRAGLVHRLDQDTSGLLVVARSLESHTKLVAQLQARAIRRRYDAVVYGVVEGPGKVDMPIARHAVNRKRMTTRADGKPSVTFYYIHKQYRGHTHLRVHLETGRTHQIRVHMAYLNHPVIGDQVYGGKFRATAGGDISLEEMLAGFSHQALHARELAFVHPITDAEVRVEAPCPADMLALLAILDRVEPGI